MLSRRDMVEKELGVRVPEEYANFLEKHGIYHAPGIEVYGINESLSHYDGIPCVIGATRNARKHEGLPHRFLVIEHLGIEDVMTCLDTKDGKVYSISRVYGNRKIADSFDEWFETDIIEFGKRDRPSKYAGQKILFIDKD